MSLSPVVYATNNYIHPKLIMRLVDWTILIAPLGVAIIFTNVPDPGTKPIEFHWVPKKINSRKTSPGTTLR